MLTAAQIEWLRGHLKTFSAFWQRADGSHVELLSVGTHAEEPNPVAYVAQPPGGYLALDNVTRDEIVATNVRKHVPVFVNDAETQAKIARGECTFVFDDVVKAREDVAKAPAPDGLLNWIVVSDACYAAIEFEDKRAAMSVDEFVLHTLTQMCVSLPHLGKPFKVFRVSDLGAEGLKSTDATRRID